MAYQTAAQPKITAARTNVKAKAKAASKTPVTRRNKFNAMIPPSILYGSDSKSSKFQCSNSPLLNLPGEILNAILEYATFSARDRIRVSLTCKHLARLLPRSILSGELPRQVDIDDSSAVVMKRFNFMMGLEDVFHAWNQEAKVPHETLQHVGGFVYVAKRLIKYEWRLCSVCLVYRNTTVINPRHPTYYYVVEIADQTDDWRCVIKRGGIHNMWICPKHKINPAKMVQLRG
ncbi:hypothetical protein DV737_g2095, partial [Chaetothyriales sp. CBS 132003]